MAGRRLDVACAVLGLLGGAAASASATPFGGPPVSVVHEEMGQSFSDLMEQFQGLGLRLRDHFAPREHPAEGPLISIMLSHRAELGLSAAQVETLQRLRGEFQKEAIRAEADLKIADTDLGMLLAADPVDLARVEATIRTIEKRRADLRVARIRTIEQGRAQLSPEQREKLRALLAQNRPPGMRAFPVPPPPPPPHPGGPGRL